MENPDEAGQYRCLVKHFFMRFFDFDSISSPQIDSIEKNALTIQVLALMVLPGVLKSLLLMSQKYGYYIYRPIAERDAATITDKCFFLSLSMITIGFLAVFEWDMLFPDRRDYLILTPFPITVRTVFYAKLAALAAFLMIFTVAVNIGPTFLFPNAVLTNNGFAHRVFGKTIPVSLIIRYVFSHGISILLGNVFIFLSAISLQGILLTLIPARFAWVISRCIRFLCLLVLLCTLLSFTEISSVDQLIRSASPLTAYYPPIWFVGIYDVLLGSHDAAMRSLAERAAIALAFAGVLSVLTYAMCYRRFLRSSLESGAGASHHSVGVRNAGNFLLDRWLAQKPENRASFHFVGQTIFRSPRHVLYMGTFFIVGFSVAAVELTATVFNRHLSGISHLNNALLSIPLVLSFFLLVGTRISFGIPVALEANWLFRLAPIRQIAELHAGVRKFMICAIIVPLFTMAGLFYALIWDWRTILLHVGYGIALSLLLMELLFSRFPKIPFTCSYLPGASRIVVLWPFYVLGFRLFGYAAANVEIWLLDDPIRFLYFYVPAAALFIILLFQNTRSSGRGIRFEEESERAPIYLDLRS